MLIDINKIVVGDRIRKDFGDIKELAEDIKENTLLNALVVTPSGNGDGTYLLIAGERRLRACKSLGYKAVTVNSVGVDDAEQALMMEISENECRKEFTKTERLEYARRLARLEKAKSEQGKRTDLAQDVVQGERNRAANAVAQTLGTNRETLRQEQFIADNSDLLDPADFADWDEGKLSTNKAYQRIKAAKEQAERERDDARETVALVQRVSDALKRERDDAREEVEALGEDIGDLQREVAALEKQADKAYEVGYRAAEASAAKHAAQPQVVTREVESEAARNLIKRYESESRRHAEEYESLRHRYESVKSELDHVRKAQEDGVNTPHGDAFADALGELVATRHRYSNVAELADVFAEIDMLASQSLEGGSGK